MPSIRQAVAVPPARTIVVRSAGAVPPPGSVPTSGAANTSGPAGRIAFESHVLIVGADPTIAMGSFPQRLSETLREADTLGPSTQASPADIGIGVASASVAEQSAVGNPSTGWGFTTPPARWVTIAGSFNAASSWSLDRLNKAIARALANSTTFPGATGPRIPARDQNSNGTAGSPLLEAFNRPGACTGARDYTKVYAAACTRWAPLAQNALNPGASTPASTTQPQGTLTQIAQSPSEPALCSFVTRAHFWLRPTATFAQSGPDLPAGTRVDLMDVTSQTQGNLRLYDVRVAATQTVAAARPYTGQRGWAAMSAADVSSCASVIAARDAAKRSATSPTPGTGNTAIVPSTPATPAMRPESTSQPGQVVTTRPVAPVVPPAPGSSKTPYIVGGALVVTAGLMYWKRDALRRMFR